MRFQVVSVSVIALIASTNAFAIPKSSEQTDSTAIVDRSADVIDSSTSLAPSTNTARDISSEQPVLERRAPKFTIYAARSAAASHTIMTYLTRIHARILSQGHQQWEVTGVTEGQMRELGRMAGVLEISHS